MQLDRRALLISALLTLAVVLVFCQTGRHEFVNFDDDRYVYDNDHIKPGLTLRNLGYYLVHRHSYTYHPVTSISHMLDCTLFGARMVDAGKHHWMSVVFHAATAVGLFLVLRQMTARLWPSALVAAVFAIHPLRVESVAWISERRDVLSGVFFVGTIWAYVRYVRQPQSKQRNIVLCLIFALGLLTKPMLVTLPLVLLLLDYWPLDRWRIEADKDSLRCGAGSPAKEQPGEVLEPVEAFPPIEFRPSALEVVPTLVEHSPPVRRRLPWHLLIEKLPLFALSFIDCLITLFTQGDGGAIQSLDLVSWKARIANASIAYANYLGCFFWPRGLAVLYPHPLDNFNLHESVWKAALLAAVTAGAWILRRRMPYLLVGWLWYLITLIPVIGMLQVGGQSMADRYTYLPQIGLAIAVVWGLAGAVKLVGVRAVPAFASAAILAALAAAAWLQTTYWRNSESLWVRETSFPQYDNAVSHYNYGLVLAERGNHPAAAQQYEAALSRDPTDEASRLNLGLSYEALGSADAAILQYRKILEVNAKSTSGLTNLARLLQDRGDDREAVKHLRAAHEEEPLNYTTCTQLAFLLAASPDNSLRNGGEALRVAQRAVELSKAKDAATLDARAAAYAETGDFAAAEVDAKAALKLATNSDDKKLAGAICNRLALYQSKKPYRLTVRSKEQSQNPKQSQNRSHRISEESKHESFGGTAAASSNRRS